jgi:hypothetical protein
MLRQNIVANPPRIVHDVLDNLRIHSRPLDHTQIIQCGAPSGLSSSYLDLVAKAMRAA